MASPDPLGDELARLRHDLRTPLAIVAGFGELLASDRRLDDAARRDYAQRVVDAADELKRMIDGGRPLR